jgi:inhibitor of KinA sporulation pathway (predicted exonuclease)
MLNARTLRVENVFHSYVRPVKMPKLTAFCTKLTGITQATVDDAPTFEPVFDAIRQWLQAHDFLDENSSPAARPISTVKPPAPVSPVPVIVAGAQRESAPVRGAWAAPKAEKKVTASPTPAQSATSSTTSATEAKNAASGVKKIKTFAFATCGDWDLNSMLPEQLTLSGIACPSYFRSWINIKRVFEAYSKTSAHKDKVRKSGKGDQERLGMPTMLGALGLPLEGKHHSGIDDVKNLVAVCSSLLRANVVTFDITASSDKISRSGKVKGASNDGNDQRAAKKAAHNAAAKIPKVVNVIATPAKSAATVVSASPVTTATPTSAAPSTTTTPAQAVAPVKTAASVVAAANAAAAAKAAALVPPPTTAVVAPATTSGATAAKKKPTGSSAVAAVDDAADSGWTKAPSKKRAGKAK